MPEITVGGRTIGKTERLLAWAEAQIVEGETLQVSSDHMLDLVKRRLRGTPLNVHYAHGLYHVRKRDA